MSDWYYKTVRAICVNAFLVSGFPIVRHRERARRRGAYILAPNHFSPLDVPCLIKETPRMLDFVSIAEVYNNPLVSWFYHNMNAMPLDRGRVDTVTTRQILQRLRAGRVVAMFPEGRVQDDRGSVLNGGRIKTGLFGIARMANVPIIPCVILGTRAYNHPLAWLPLRSTVFAINYGRPMFPNETWEDLARPEKQLREQYRQLHVELLDAARGCEIA